MTPGEPVEVEWEAPPEARKRSMYSAAVAQVKQRPGQWARVRVLDSSSGAYSARAGLQRFLGKDERWETRAAEREDGSWGVYLRYRNDDQMKEVKR